MASKRTQPAWNPPASTSGVVLPPLKLFNSLTGKKEDFVPEKGMDVQWYCCGPTVYDDSHMGHARTYISFDILRRILRDYFKFNVKYVMNITDIDDKIIKRARQRYLFEEYSKTKTNADNSFIISNIREALQKLELKLSKETDPDKKVMMTKEVKKINDLLNSKNNDVTTLLATGKDLLSDFLDGKFGSTVSANEIFRDLPRLFEDAFHADMKALNILPADILIRVSDVVPEIVDYCQKIIDNGFGYVSNGSVYFDTNKFATAPGHFYAKLVPTAFGDQEQLKEGEGVLSTDRVDEKRSQTDFALWKTSKPGEPGWDSPWGRGRPGWHIECSVMASSACGPSMDIHTGGVDLKFPHHDNELAQSEAYFGHSHWVRYFLHAGHLTIEGCKMSKSLKNFITIREVLASHPSRRLRLAFLLHSWKDTMDYSRDTMVEAAAFDRMLLVFFFNVMHYERLSEAGMIPACPSELDEVEKELQAKIGATEKIVHDSLCDSVDTREALLAMRDLVTACNLYLRDRASGEKIKVRVTLLRDAGRLLTKIFRIMGCGSPYVASEEETAMGLEEITAEDVKAAIPPLVTILLKFCSEVRRLSEELKNNNLVTVADGVPEKIMRALSVNSTDTSPSGIKAAASQAAAAVPSRRPLQALNPLLTLVAEQREVVRAEARREKMTAVLQLSDQLRDEFLPEVGVRLEDREAGQAPAIGLMSRLFLEEEQAERQAAKDSKARQKAEKERLAAEKAEQARLPPWEMFRRETSKFSRFDDRGMPTHDAKGDEITKSQLKKLQKQYDAQEKKYNELKAKAKS